MQWTRHSENTGTYPSVWTARAVFKNYTPLDSALSGSGFSWSMQWYIGLTTTTTLGRVTVIPTVTEFALTFDSILSGTLKCIHRHTLTPSSHPRRNEHLPAHVSIEIFMHFSTPGCPPVVFFAISGCTFYHTTNKDRATAANFWVVDPMGGTVECLRGRKATQNSLRLHVT
jgi:hypothetical protein